MALRLCGQKNILLLLSRRMKQLLSLLAFILLLSSCSIERRHYLPGFHVEGRGTSDKGLVTSDEGRMTNYPHGADDVSEALPNAQELDFIVSTNSSELIFTSVDATSKMEAISKSARVFREISHSSLVTSHSPLLLDTLKKPFKPQQQYREVDPAGKWSVFVVLAAVVIQKIVATLTWFEFIVPWTFGPGIFIPALIIALIGVGLQAYSAYRVRKYPDKYKKNEWGKAAIAILGWQILMSLLFAWLLGGLPIG
jgi:hypothetical protein